MAYNRNWNEAASDNANSLYPDPELYAPSIPAPSPYIPPPPPVVSDIVPAEGKGRKKAPAKGARKGKAQAGASGKGPLTRAQKRKMEAAEKEKEKQARDTAVPAPLPALAPPAPVPAPVPAPTASAAYAGPAYGGPIYAGPQLQTPPVIPTDDSIMYGPPRLLSQPGERIPLAHRMDPRILSLDNDTRPGRNVDQALFAQSQMQVEPSDLMPVGNPYSWLPPFGAGGVGVGMANGQHYPSHSQTLRPMNNSSQNTMPVPAPAPLARGYPDRMNGDNGGMMNSGAIRPMNGDNGGSMNSGAIHPINGNSTMNGNGTMNDNGIMNGNGTMNSTGTMNSGVHGNGNDNGNDNSNVSTAEHQAKRPRTAVWKAGPNAPVNNPINLSFQQPMTPNDHCNFLIEQQNQLQLAQRGYLGKQSNGAALHPLLPKDKSAQPVIPQLTQNFSSQFAHPQHPGSHFRPPQHPGPYSSHPQNLGFQSYQSQHPAFQPHQSQHPAFQVHQPQPLGSYIPQYPVQYPGTMSNPKMKGRGVQNQGPGAPPAVPAAAGGTQTKAPGKPATMPAIANAPSNTGTSGPPVETELLRKKRESDRLFAEQEAARVVAKREIGAPITEDDEERAIYVGKPHPEWITTVYNKTMRARIEALAAAEAETDGLSGKADKKYYRNLVASGAYTSLETSGDPVVWATLVPAEEWKGYKLKQSKIQHKDTRPWTDDEGRQRKMTDEERIEWGRREFPPEDFEYADAGTLAYHAVDQRAEDEDAKKYGEPVTFNKAKSNAKIGEAGVPIAYGEFEVLNYDGGYDYFFSLIKKATIWPMDIDKKVEMAMKEYRTFKK
ncbi:hypothetical protein F5Y17DRAFT_452655 [Xylariaceae sp. FL0594]|nr:hypothetical protein F5Y17DRAFT_452655 [Xylariaceae sp. FL0594]